jgi:sarcosine oxidase subunit gamma
MTHIALRGSSAPFFAACESVLGMRPPAAPNAVAWSATRSILWLGPNEWLVVDQESMLEKLRAALAGIHSAAVDVTSSRKALIVSGERAEEVLAKAATLDFGLAAFPVGSCAQTNVARTQGIIWRRGAQDFVIYVRSSFAAYLGAWLDDAGEG